MVNNPNDQDLNSLVGRALTELQSFREAIPFLENVVSGSNSDASSRAWALNYLGKCNFALGDYTNSKSNFQKCIELNATKNATNSSSGWMGALGFDPFYSDWRIIETGHFIFHFPPNIRISNVDEFAEEREVALVNINSFFASSLPKKIDYFLWNSELDAQSVGISKLGFAKPEFCVIHSLIDQSIGHEMTHVITHQLVGNPKKISLINEGTAVHFDQTGQDKLRIVKSKLRGQFVSVTELWENWEALSPEVSYPLSGAFVKLLIEKGGKEKFLELLKDQSFDNAAVIYGEQLSDIITEFERSLSE